MTRSSPKISIRIRRAAAADAAALYAIALLTGDHGADVTQLYQDPDLMGDIYVGPYLAQGLALVAEDASGVAGFAVGALDSRAFEAAAEAKWWPSLRARKPRPSGDPSGFSADAARRERIHTPRILPAAVVARWPAHLHLNIHPRAQGFGLGPRLAQAWMADAYALGARAAHVAVSLRNPRGERFWRRMGFHPIAPVADPAFAQAVWLGRDLDAAAALDGCLR